MFYGKANYIFLESDLPIVDSLSFQFLTMTAHSFSINFYKHNIPKGSLCLSHNEHLYVKANYVSWESQVPQTEFTVKNP